MFTVPLPGSFDFTSIEADFQFTSDSGAIVYEQKKIYLVNEK